MNKFKSYKETYPLIESKDMKEVLLGKFQKQEVRGMIKKEYDISFTTQELDEIFAMHRTKRLEDHIQKEYEGNLYYISCDGYSSYIISVIKDANKKLIPIGIFNKP